MEGHGTSVEHRKLDSHILNSNLVLHYTTHEYITILISHFKVSIGYSIILDDNLIVCIPHEFSGSFNGINAQ